VKKLVAVIGFALLVLSAAVCALESGGGDLPDLGGGLSAPGGGGVPVDCPDEMEPVKLGKEYHGYRASIKRGGECLGDLCVNFDGQLSVENLDRASWDMCSGGQWGMPEEHLGGCNSTGWIDVWWDGESRYYCASFRAVDDWTALH